MPTPPTAYQPPELTAAQRRRLRRTGITVIVLLDTLVIAVGITGSADLRQLSTPQGVARAYVDAAAVNDCQRRLDTQTHALRAAHLAGAAADPRYDGTPTGRYCQAVHDAFRDDRVTGARVLGRDGPTATVDVTVDHQGQSRTVHLRLVHTGGRWRVAAEG
jgi:hypothetical protein